MDKALKMATPFVATSIGKKTLAAITGAILFGFTIGHLAGNLQIFLPLIHPLAEGDLHPLDAYGMALKGNKILLYGVRSLLLVSALVHVVMTLQIAAKAKAARSTRYQYKNQEQATSTEQGALERLARGTMIISGPILLFYIIYHLLHFTVGLHVGGHEFVEGAAYANVVRGFQNPWVAGFYMGANLLLGIHLLHGGRALFQTLGLKHPRYDALLSNTALAFCVFVCTGNVLIPVTVVSGLIGNDESVDASLRALEAHHAASEPAVYSNAE